MNSAGGHHSPTEAAEQAPAPSDQPESAIIPFEASRDHRADQILSARDFNDDGRPSAHLGSGSSASTLDDAGQEAVSANAITDVSLSATVSHALDSLSGTLSDIAGAIHGGAASLTQSLTASLGNLSATITGLAHSLSEPLNLGVENTVDLILHHSPLNAIDTGHVENPIALAGELSSVSSSAAALLASVPSSFHDGPAVSDAVFNAAFGSANPTLEMHPSITSFGEFAQPIQIGFAGQSLAHTIDPHDISTHSTGSILHGFL